MFHRFWRALDQRLGRQPAANSGVRARSRAAARTSRRLGSFGMRSMSTAPLSGELTFMAVMQEVKRRSCASHAS
jgi:hypothetical protein